MRTPTYTDPPAGRELVSAVTATPWRNRDELEDEITGASAANATWAEFVMLTVLIHASNRDRLFSIGIADLARSLELRDHKNVRRVRNSLARKGMIELLAHRPPRPPIYRLAYPLSSRNWTPTAMAAQRIAAAAITTTLPLPLFADVARACARQGAHVVINHDEAKATITPSTAGGRTNG